MIRIDAVPPPEILGSPYIRQRREELFAFLRRPDSHKSQRRAPIAEELFYEGELRGAVVDRCLHKCVFCESQDAVSVEHFRPLRLARFEDNHEGDHYAWLAYEWDNLVLACEYCAHAKRDRFPVSGERAPRLASFGEVRRLEAPRLIDPYHETPGRNFDFLLDGRCAPLTPRGRDTAALLELDSDRLRQLRRHDLDELHRDLMAWSSDGDWRHIEDVFDIRRPFAGARLNALKRAVERLPYGRALTRGTLRHLPARMSGYLAGRGEDPRRLPELFEDLAKVDGAREVDPQPAYNLMEQPPQADRAAASFRYSKPRYVQEVRVSNLKGISHLRVVAGRRRHTRRGAPCLMLLGENSTGKSTLLQGIALALLGGPQARALRLDPDEFLRSESRSRWDQLEPITAHVDIDFALREGGARFILDARLRRIAGADAPAALVLGYGPRRYFDRRRTSAPQQPHGRVKTLFDPTATIPYPGTWLNSLSDHDFHAVARALRPILALSDSDNLVRDTDGRVSVVVEDRPVPIERLSEGYRSMFTLAVDIFREMMTQFLDLEEAHGVVLIDEIETHLHPRWKMQIMRAMRRAVPGVQFIVTTHDPLCLRGMEDGEVVVLQRNGEGEIEFVRDLPSLRGMRAEQLLTSDYFGLSSTIDPETELAVARFAADVAERPDEHITSEAISRLTLGDSAGEQLIQAALQRFLDAREKPAGALRSDVRAEAVEAVYRALAGPPPREDKDSA